MSSSAASMKKRVLVIVTNEAFIPINRESQQAQSPEDFRFLEAAKIEPNVTNKNYTGAMWQFNPFNLPFISYSQ